MTKSLSDYAPKSDSVSLKHIDGKKFHIVGVEDSNYTEGENSTPGVKITTKEEFDVEGQPWRKFHTTRTAVVSKLKNEQLRADIESGSVIGPVMCKEVKSKTGGKPYIDLVEA